MRYLLTDHLGSLEVITDALGSLVQTVGFDPWGQRRRADTGAALAALARQHVNSALTMRGYSDHEMVDTVGLIHMNGRSYDPRLGRFLQADPVMQFPDDTQGHNRYSYVLNNPLAYTDPTGYILGKVFKPVFRGLHKVFGDAAPFVSLALLAIPGVNTWVLASWQHAVGFGFFAGGIATGSLRGALFGGISAAAFYATGTHFSAVTGLPAGGIGQTLAHGVTGGILAELQGGQFGHGFISAGLTKAVLGRLRYHDGSAGAVLSRTTLAAMVGGTVSRITGGKFANGALTAAMAQLFNQETSAARQAALENKYSIKVDGRELNPDGYVLDNDILRENIAALYTDMVNEMGTDQFQFRVTGGDRFIGADGKVYSSTDGSFVGRSGLTHIRGDAVDMRIKYNDGRLLPVNIVRLSVNRTKLIFDPNAMPHHYDDKHYHLQLPRDFNR